MKHNFLTIPDGYQTWSSNTGSNPGGVNINISILLFLLSIGSSRSGSILQANESFLMLHVTIVIFGMCLGLCCILPWPSFLAIVFVLSVHWADMTVGCGVGSGIDGGLIMR
jgi:hypothetical protein